MVTELLKLNPDAAQAEALLDTMRTHNAAANRAAEVAFQHGTADKIRVQRLVYSELRDPAGPFRLGAQMAILAVHKACGAYRPDKTVQPVFRPLGAIAYDQRILSWKARDLVSMLTISAGRIRVPVAYQGRWAPERRDRIRGQADLVYRDGVFYLAVVIDVDEPPPGPEPDEWLGVDLGIVNIASTSDGDNHCGKGLRGVRRRNRALRARLQAKGTKSAKRLLRKRRRRDARHGRDVNHCISKTIVGNAQRTGRGIALENLHGIRGRVTVTRAQRADLGSWSFNQLQVFIGYKAALAGVPVRAVDPRNTSRTCPQCGCVDKRNRPTRDEFRCLLCGFAGPADIIAAGNIASRAAVMRPDAA